MILTAKAEKTNNNQNDYKRVGQQIYVLTRVFSCSKKIVELEEFKFFNFLFINIYGGIF